MTLRVDTVGTGPDLVVLHGWSLHCGLFDGIADDLAVDFTVHFIDLPGHGHNAGVVMPATVDATAEQVLYAAPAKAHWMGWSIGGAIAMAAAARKPERIDRLVTVAATPKFTAADDWPHAVPEEKLDAMAEDLAGDWHRTVNQFLSLQVLGDEHAQSLLRDLRKRLYAHGEPGQESLANGLRILHDTDLREQVKALSMPWLAIMGQRDRLASPKVGEWIAANVPTANKLTIARAAHAPFVSHRLEFLDALKEFLLETA